MTTRTNGERHFINLSTPLSMGSSFRFPFQSADSCREILWGAVLLVLLPGVGWILNMGHRVVVVHRMQHGQAPWPAWHDYGALFRHGVITTGGMLYYYTPGLILGYAAWRSASARLALVAGALLLSATIAIPGFMSHYCQEFDPSEIYDPLRALRRCIQGGGAYWRAWLIALSALVISFVGLVALGLGFLVTSVWFWQVAGFSFASVFTQRFGLAAAKPPPIAARDSLGRWPLILCVSALYLLHQDSWNWDKAFPLVFGFLPIGLFYHICYSLAAALLMWLLVTFAWPAHLENRPNDSVIHEELRSAGAKHNR